ncbi:MAG: glutathione S-transferase family protein [Alphaproteobacteria bacterium]|nr:glutathione S-transferase family protein [Alphaproteobacteria bacterium]
MPMRLYSGPLSMFGAKAEIAALEKGLDVRVEMVPFDMKALYEPKHPEVLRVNPKRQVPVLIDGDVEIFDSTQIFEYFEEIKPQPPLWPTSVRGRARARLLEMKSDEVFFPHIVRLMGLQRSLDDPAAVAAIGAAVSYDREVEALLADGRRYLVGDYSYADIAFYMAQFFADRLGAPMPLDVGCLLAWRDRMTARPAVRQVATAMARYLVSVGGRKPGFIAV